MKFTPLQLLLTLVGISAPRTETVRGMDCKSTRRLRKEARWELRRQQQSAPLPNLEKTVAYT